MKADDDLYVNLPKVLELIHSSPYSSEEFLLGNCFCDRNRPIKVGLCKRVFYGLLPHWQIKYPVDFDDELKIGDVRYDKMT